MEGRLQTEAADLGSTSKVTFEKQCTTLENRTRVPDEKNWENLGREAKVVQNQVNF